MLERGHQLESIGAWLSDAGAGRGRIGLVVAGAGLGKTALLQRAGELAEEQRFRVLRARGGELEREMPFGVVRQLFEAVIRELPPADRDALFAGAAGPARPVVDPGHAGLTADPTAVMHALYWTLAGLAEGTPLLLLIDDLHWGDEQTGNWLEYLAGRLAHLPVLVMLATRPAEPEAGAVVARLQLAPQVSGLTLDPLGPDAVLELVAARLGGPRDSTFARACREATGGNPFFLIELLRAVAGDGIVPAAKSASLIAQLGPGEIARAILLRLARLGEDARRLSEAVAVLGADAELRHASELAGLGRDRALAAWDRLVAGDILAPRQPLEFIHPVARTAVYRELGPGERARAHRRAGQLLAAEGSDPQRVAVHALACEPAADPEIVEWLLDAARDAVAGGAPDAAARLLERALREPPTPDRLVGVHLELGRALLGLNSAEAAAHFAVAATGSDPATRLLALRWQAYTLSFVGQLAPSMAAYDRAIAWAETMDDPDLAPHLRGMRDFFRAWWGEGAERLADQAVARERIQSLPGRSLGERQVLAAATVAAIHAASISAAEALATAPRLSAAPIRWTERQGDVTQGAIAFVHLMTDSPDATRLLEMRAIPQCLAEGRTVDLGFAYTCLTVAYFRRGELAAAESAGRIAWSTMRTVGRATLVVYLWAATALVEVLIARGELAEAERVLAESGLISERPAVVTFPWPPVLIGEMALAAGRVADGARILAEAGAWLDERGFRNPAYIPWRARLAPALAALGRPAEAEATIGPALDLARRFGAPWALGATLRAAGVVRSDPALLREAIGVLAPRFRLEHATAELELGALLRRGNRRSAAREPLRRALAVAERCGAALLAARASEELAATGARPRRAMLTGVDALTASERRVAELAASGLSNPEIAQRLFVTRKTIETHLGRIYLKLDIRSRDELPAAMTGAPVHGRGP